MKRFKMVVVALVGACVLFSADAFAQQKSRINFDKAFIGVSGGVNTTVLKLRSTDLWGGAGIATDINAGIWWSPEVGTRIGWHGLTNSSRADLGVPAGDPYAFDYFHFDVLWDITTTIGGENPDRFWRLAPYITGGLLGLGNDSKVISSSYNWYSAGGAGFLNMFKIGKNVDLTLDLKGLVYYRKPHDIMDTITCCLILHPSALVGVQFYF